MAGKPSALLAGCLLVALMFGGCAGQLGLLGEYDDTCFDCRTVCDGTKGDYLDGCLAACVECQGYSKCFSWLEGEFQGMTGKLEDWVPVDCKDLN